MRILIWLSDMMIPMIIMMIVSIGVSKRVAVLDAFIEGAKDGFKVVLDILPTLIGLMIAVGVVRSSGLLDYVTQLIKPLGEIIGFPAALIPVAILRTISASASTGLVLDIFRTYGPDSFIGKMTSIMMGCTETIFYTMSIYFMTVNIRKTRYALPGALLVTLVGIIASVILTYYLY